MMTPLVDVSNPPSLRCNRAAGPGASKAGPTTSPVTCAWFRGWARDPVTAPIVARIYKDGPAGQGTFLVEVLADQLRRDLPWADQNHGFNYQFDINPGLLDDGKIHTIYVYGYASYRDGDAIGGR